MSNPDDFLPSFDDYAEFRSALEDAEEAKRITRRASRDELIILGEAALDETLEEDDNESDFDIDDSDKI
jgi:hypothetical protein